MNDGGKLLQVNLAADAPLLAGIAQHGLALPGGPEEFFLADVADVADVADAPTYLAARFRAARPDDDAHAVKLVRQSGSAAEVAGQISLLDRTLAAVVAIVGGGIDEVKTRVRSGWRAGWRSGVDDGETVRPVKVRGDAGQKAPAVQHGPDPAPSTSTPSSGNEPLNLIPSQPEQMPITMLFNDMSFCESGDAQPGAQIGGRKPSDRSATDVVLAGGRVLVLLLGIAVEIVNWKRNEAPVPARGHTEGINRTEREIEASAGGLRPKLQGEGGTGEP